MTRRAFIAASAALLANPVSALTGRRPVVIAHRGASGERPEHTELAYRLAIEEGCDFIEPDLVLSKDGVLVARHENEIAGTTDVASKAEFADRKTTKTIDGAQVEGWFTEDFTLAELKTLRARERLPQLRPASAKFDGMAKIMTFDEVATLAKLESRRTGRTIGVYPEMKHPSFLASVGLPIEGRLAEALKKNELDAHDAPVFVQCFEAAPLKTFKTLSKARRVQLVGRETPEMVTAEGLKAISQYADGVGPDWSLVLPTVDGALTRGKLVENAHAVGLAVHPWTVRAENAFLPKSLQRGDSPAAHGDVDALFAALWAAGVDGLFSDFPGLAVKSRG